MTNAAVLVHRTMSLDGYIAGPDHEMDWIFQYPAPGDIAEIIEATGAILAGRRTYEVGRRDAGKGSGAPYGGAWSGPVFVLTHQPPEAADSDSVTFLCGDIRTAVATALEPAEGKKLEVFGADVATQCLEHGLVEEILVHVAPVLLGDGVRLFAARERAKVELDPIGATRSGPVAHLRFRVRG
jgi:dihydrofolate reductase